MVRGVVNYDEENRRPVKITHKKGKKEEVRYGLWQENVTQIVGDKDKIVTKLLAVIEFEDGHIEWIDHKNFVFLDTFDPVDWFVDEEEENEVEEWII